MATQLSVNMPMEAAMHEARLLLSLSLARETPILTHEDISLSEASFQKLQSFIANRLDGMPISRMRGWREFYGLRFDLNKETLDPRPDSEILVDTALAFAKANGWAETPISLADFGTGSGCLLLSCLANLVHAKGIGIDISDGALHQAAANADTLGVGMRAQFVRSNWADELEAQKFHIILSNPPYVETTSLDDLSAEVRLHDPHRALFAGEDGLSDYRLLMPILKSFLHEDGRAFIELGYGQADAVKALAIAAGLTVSGSETDLAGIQRCLCIQL